MDKQITMKEYLIYTLIALFAFGIQTFLYKVSAARRCNSALTTRAFMITVAVLSGVFFFYSGTKENRIWILIIFAVINSVFFLITTITRMEALKNIPTSVSYPIIRASTIFVVLFSLIYFREKLSFYQITGIVLSIAVVFILSKREKKDKILNFKRGIYLTIIAMITSALTTIAQKFAALSVNKLAYITLSYIINIGISSALIKSFKKKETEKTKRDAKIIGFFIGIFNFIGFFSILKAYSQGPLAITAPLHDMNFVIAIILAGIIYKEKVTLRRVVGIVLSVVSVVLLSLG